MSSESKTVLNANDKDLISFLFFFDFFFGITSLFQVCTSKRTSPIKITFIIIIIIIFNELSEGHGFHNLLTVFSELFEKQILSLS